MTLDKATIEALAEHLESCQLQARDTTKITDDHPDMDWEDAYAIQAALLARKQARGLRLAGLKAGLLALAGSGAGFIEHGGIGLRNRNGVGVFELRELGFECRHQPQLFFLANFLNVVLV